MSSDLCEGRCGRDDATEVARSYLATCAAGRVVSKRRCSLFAPKNTATGGGSRGFLLRFSDIRLACNCKFLFVPSAINCKSELNMRTYNETSSIATLQVRFAHSRVERAAESGGDGYADAVQYAHRAEIHILMVISTRIIEKRRSQRKLHNPNFPVIHKGCSFCC